MFKNIIWYSYGPESEGDLEDDKNEKKLFKLEKSYNIPKYKTAYEHLEQDQKTFNLMKKKYYHKTPKSLFLAMSLLDQEPYYKLAEKDASRYEEELRRRGYFDKVHKYGFIFNSPYRNIIHNGWTFYIQKIMDDGHSYHYAL